MRPYFLGAIIFVRLHSDLSPLTLVLRPQTLALSPLTSALYASGKERAYRLFQHNLSADICACPLNGIHVCTILQIVERQRSGSSIDIPLCHLLARNCV